MRVERESKGWQEGKEGKYGEGGMREKGMEGKENSGGEVGVKTYLATLSGTGGEASVH